MTQIIIGPETEAVADRVAEITDENIAVFCICTEKIIKMN